MRGVRFTSGNRNGRAFGDPADSAKRGRTAFFEDDDDRARDKMLSRLFRRGGIASAVAHPTLGVVGEVQVFFSSSEGFGQSPPIFACTIISQRRLDELIRDRTPVVERFTLQVADDTELDRPAIQKALWAWVKRSYPALDSLRAIKVSVYAETPTSKAKPRVKFSMTESRFYSVARVVPASMVA